MQGVSLGRYHALKNHQLQTATPHLSDSATLTVATLRPHHLSFPAPSPGSTQGSNLLERSRPNPCHGFLLLHQYAFLETIELRGSFRFALKRVPHV